MLEVLIVILIVGAIAGWLAGLLVQGTGFGLLGDILVGILGALVTGFLLPEIGIVLAVGGGILGSIIAAFIGAVILLVVVKLLKRLFS
jgi:uncharacterized membrane protein YeaQ/YmgE (transglycosylase-associated protein family)